MRVQTVVWGRASRRAGVYGISLVAWGVIGVASAILMALTSAYPAFAKDAIEPWHEKTLLANGDGTYTLSLAVRGEVSSETHVARANVVIVYDTSGSMKMPVASDTGRWGFLEDYEGEVPLSHASTRLVELFTKATNNAGEPVYTLIEDDTTTGPVWWLDASECYQEYTGARYSADARIDVERDEILALASVLLRNNTASGREIELALVQLQYDATCYDFDANTWETTVGTAGTWTTSVDALRAALPGVSDEGTNWEAAFQLAKQLADAKFAEDGDETYIIFVSDGNPTYYVLADGSGMGGTGWEDSDNIQESYLSACDDARAIVGAGYTMYAVGIFGSVSRMQDVVSYANEATGEDKGVAYYYAASRVTALESAMKDISSSITHAAAFEQVVITDGVTGLTSTSIGQAGGFTYTVMAPDATSHVIALAADNTIAAIDGDTAPVTLKDDMGVTLKLTVGDAFPAASFTDGTVTWNLSSLGQLLNGYTWRVSFVVWPSQQAYDTLAALANGQLDESQLDATQFVRYTASAPGSNGEVSGWGLRTNTQAGLAFDVVEKTNGTETSRVSGTADFGPSPSMPLVNTQLTVQKVWNCTDEQIPDGDVVLELLCDGQASGVRVTLGAGTGWKADVAVAPGLQIGAGDDLRVLEAGHTYALREVQGGKLWFTFSSGASHPMLDNSATAVVETVAAATADGGGRLVLTATNTYHATQAYVTLDVNKVLKGRALQPGEFTFELVNSENEVMATVCNDAEGKVTFPALTFDEPGTYSFTVREVVPISPDGVTYAEAQTVRITVTDNNRGALEAEIGEEGAADDMLRFTNVYRAQIPATGDTSLLALALAAAALSGVALAAGRRVVRGKA